MKETNDPHNNLCVGQITGAHGIRGQIRLRSFTDDPEAIFTYEPLTTEDGKQEFRLTPNGINKDCFIASVTGIKTRTAAEALRGTKLFFDRAKLPKPKKGEYYESDLIGLTAQDGQGRDHGKILAVHNYGAGPFLEIGQSKKTSFMLPFTDACVPEIDTKTGLVQIAPPDGWLDKEKPDPDQA